MNAALPPLRVRIFVDFWNFQLSLSGLEKSAGNGNFNIDWLKLPTVCCDQVNQIVQPAAGVAYEGLHIYSSYTDGNGTDMRHKNWIENWLDRQAGVNAQCVKRSKKHSAPKCPACYVEAVNCHSCGSDMRGMEEKGVDTRLVTDMLSLAWNDAYDVAVLITADRDFIPVAEELQSRGVKVIHAQIGRSGMELAQKCWANFDLYAERANYRR